MPKKTTSHLKGTSHVTYREDGCNDDVTLSLEITNEKIVGLSIKPGKTSCDPVKKISLALEKHVIGKHLADAYKITSETLDGTSTHHGATLVVHALREAILAYESDKASSSLQDALHMLESYDEGLPPRAPETDYEF